MGLSAVSLPGLPSWVILETGLGAAAANLLGQGWQRVLPGCAGTGQEQPWHCSARGQSTPSEGRRQLQFPRRLCRDFWPSGESLMGWGPALSHPELWLPGHILAAPNPVRPQRAGSPWGSGVCCEEGSLRWRPGRAHGPPLPLILPLVGRASALREEAAAGPAAPAAWLPSAPSRSQRAQALMSPWPWPKLGGGEGLEKKSRGGEEKPLPWRGCQ